VDFRGVDVAVTTGSQYIELPDPLRFEWDPDKSRSNAAKHGMEFYRGAAAFEDPGRVIISSSRAHAVEARYSLYGCSDPNRSEVIAVVFTIRGDRIRIFSVRKASRDERRAYSSHQALP
jgi:uncharacterized protein